jgi:cell fate (sporulation/competence/biofilm development) regulator YmcA (YheA/YmcA/DUF963 family)
MTKLEYKEAITQLRDALKESQELKIEELTKELLDEPLVEVVAVSTQDSIDEVIQLSGISQTSIDSIRAFQGAEDSLISSTVGFDVEEF